MSFLAAVNPASAAPAPKLDDDRYIPGVCNIGPNEIRRRRRTGYVGTAITIGLFAALVLIGAPPITRLLLFLPAAIAASGFIQAYLKFCAGFGQLGVFNFADDRSSMEHVVDKAARAKDRRKAWQIGLASGLIGLAVAIVAVFLPL